MQPQAANPITAFLPILLMFAIFYFLLIRPQQKKQKEHQEMVKNLKKGDRVVTSGGVVGTIHTLQDDYVVLKTGEGDTKLEVLRSHVSELRK
ncbi:MAG: preprotein translocase subunit YajC [Candidatus Omnitrophica bacterium]|nr:preprotein translocase subunit YajC [Candidatus Omnitrophota bacterium]